MFLKNKKAQISIEMLILVLAVLLGGSLLATQMTKDNGSYNEISGVKKLVFGGTYYSSVINGKSSGNFASLGVDNSSNTSEIPIVIRIVPGNGNNVEFEIRYDTSLDSIVYFLNNGGHGSGKSNILNSAEGDGLVKRDLNSNSDSLVLEKGSGSSYSGEATYIYVKTKGGTVDSNYGGIIELEAKNSSTPILFRINTTNGGYGQYYLEILNPSAVKQVNEEIYENGYHIVTDIQYDTNGNNELEIYFVNDSTPQVNYTIVYNKNNNEYVVYENENECSAIGSAFSIEKDIAYIKVRSNSKDTPLVDGEDASKYNIFEMARSTEDPITLKLSLQDKNTIKISVNGTMILDVE